MTTRQKIQMELDKLDELGLKEVLSQVKSYVKSRKGKQKSEQGVMEALRAVKKIQGPPDFSRNLDLYLSGEKCLEDHLPGHAVRRRTRKRS
jgi:hypothetical protein